LHTERNNVGGGGGGGEFFFFSKINFCKMAKLSPKKTFATKNITISHGFG